MTCKNCGAKIPKDSPFCTVCGKDFDSPPSDMGTQPQSGVPRTGFGAQPFGSPMGNAFMQMPTMQKRSYKKTIISVLLTIAIVAAILLFVIHDLTSNEKQILGVWKSKDSYTRFNSNGTMEPALGEHDIRYNYDIDGDELTIHVSGKEAVYKIISLDGDFMTLEYTADSQILEFSKVQADDSKVDKIINSGKLRTANKNAEAIYNSLNSGIENSTDKAVISDKPLDVAALKNSENPIEKKVYETMKTAYWGERGYVIIHFDPTCSDDGKNENFIQWSATEDGEVIGQYPDPVPENMIDSVRFGKRFKK